MSVEPPTTPHQEGPRGQNHEAVSTQSPTTPSPTQNHEVVSVEPPANMQIMNETFRQMIDDEYYVLKRQLFAAGE